jgi:hypothetical protein
MTWKLLAAGAAGLVLANLADWLFAGVLFHARYQTYPEVWRTRGADPRALIAAQVMTVPTVAGLIALLLWTGRTSMGSALVFAALVWAVAAAPAILANGLFIKLDVRVVASHTLGWLVKLALIAAAASLILHR